VLDAGDFLGSAQSVSTLDAKLKAEFLFKGMALVGYDAVALGEQDFRYGEDFLKAQFAESALKSLSANIMNLDGKSRYTAATTLLKREHYNVGVVSVLSTEHKAQLEDAHLLGGKALTISDTKAALVEGLAEIKSADLRVVLAHLSYDDARTLVSEVSGIDVMIIAHERQAPNAPHQVGSTILATTGYDGKWLGQLELYRDADETWQMGSSTGAYPLDSGYGEDKELADLYQDYLERLKGEADKIVDAIKQETPAGGSYVGGEVCTGCHAKEAEQWATTSHAKALDTLVSSNHDYDPSCLKCHTTGFAYTGGFLLPDRTPTLGNVQCEMCHGAGANHVANPATGGWAQSPQSLCVGCHSGENSPQFDMTAYLPQVSH
jgi:2',3'-cyclic-nucleotide 2'-phosphodiesterase (5'-nucleotidase family)